MLPEALSGIHVPASPGPVFALGDPGILKPRKLAFFCSVKCPGEPIVQAYDVARALRDAGVRRGSEVEIGDEVVVWE